MATFNAPDVLLPSAGLNLTYFTVKLKKGRWDLVLIHLEVKSMALRYGKGNIFFV